ncbi:hypothetical protein DDE82_006461 [Stemphylium lycopersici]|nr:hypothetical protein DDE82_006461 [Stemphylium lycopersici]
MSGRQETTARTYQGPSSTITAGFRIRRKPNPLLEDPDIEEDIIYWITPGGSITNDQLDVCAKNFSSHYGFRSGRSGRLHEASDSDRRIRVSRERLRCHCLPSAANNILVTVITKDLEQIGHCIVNQWNHRDGRVWWISQLLVIEGRRNQKRATRMLQALALHYDIGKLPDRKDLVGIASSNPYSICTALRVFGRGIEVLPSKPDWKSRNGYPHAPLRNSRCGPVLRDAPIDYIRDATLVPDSLVANTNFFIDHKAPDKALERVVHAMNQLVPEPWEWPFGVLEEGCEYVCLLEYRYDPEYRLQQLSRGRTGILNESSSDGGMGSPASSSPACQSTPGSARPSSSIPYGEIDQGLIDMPESCLPDPSFRKSMPASIIGNKRKRILEAKELYHRHGLMLPMIMDAKTIPDSLRNAYRDLEYPLPHSMTSWLGFKRYAYQLFDDDVSVLHRTLILQAIHFQDLLEQREKWKKIEKKDEAKAEKARKKETQRLSGVGERTHSKRGTRPSGPAAGTSEQQPATPKQTPPPVMVDQVCPQSPTERSPCEDLNRVFDDASSPATPSPARLDLQYSPPVSPTADSMTQRSKTRSPDLFFSDDESDDDIWFSSSGRKYPINSGKVLDRTSGKRGRQSARAGAGALNNKGLQAKIKVSGSWVNVENVIAVAEIVGASRVES